jgi:GNAT superfamily N-acetyltransferase
MWPKLNDKRKTAMVMSLYPATQKNPKLAANVVKLLDAGMGVETNEGLNEKINKEIFTPDWEEHSTILDGKYNIVAKIKYYGTIPNLFIQVFDPESDSKEPIAYVRFRITGMLWWKNLEAGMVHVVQKYRRQGIATALYQYAKKLGNTIKPSTAQLPDGKGLWQGFNAKGSLAEKMKMGATIEPIEETNITESQDYLEEK